MKHVLFYIPTRSDAEERLMRATEGLVTARNLRVCRNSENLRRGLLNRLNSPSAVVLLTVTKQDLLNLIPVRSLLLDFRVIMVLPDSDDVTLAMGWSMWPRFVSYADGDLRDVAAVLSQIIGTSSPQAGAKGVRAA